MTADAPAYRTYAQRFDALVYRHAVSPDDLLIACERIGTICDLGYDVDKVNEKLADLIAVLRGPVPQEATVGG